MRKETLAAAELVKSGYSNNRGQDDGKFKVYGKNFAASDFNSMVNRKNKHKAKI